MPNEVDKTLLDRLQALRGSSSTPERPAAAKIDVDVIERRKSPTGDDRLRDRLKNLRDGVSASPGRTGGSDRKGEADDEREAKLGDGFSQELGPLRDTSSEGQASPGTWREQKHPKRNIASIDTNLLQTSDNDLEELLRDIPAEESFAAHQQAPDDAQVKALLEQLSDSIPMDEQRDDDRNPARADEDDNSDGQDIQKEVDNVIARFRDELEMERNLDRSPSPEPSEEQEQEQEQGQGEKRSLPEISLPDVPGDSRMPAPDAISTIDDLTARLSALRAPSEDLSLPSVPSNKPAKAPKRLESRTNYTDADVDSWCTVCLADATLLCLGCEETGEPYCVQCWREMHVGPAAAFDDRSHKAVQFGKRNAKEKKVALGA